MSPEMFVVGLVVICAITGVWHFYGILHQLEQRARRAENRAREAEHLATGALLALKAHIEGEDFDIHVMKLRETEIE